MITTNCRLVKELIVSFIWGFLLMLTLIEQNLLEALYLRYQDNFLIRIRLKHAEINKCIGLLTQIVLAW